MQGGRRDRAERRRDQSGGAVTMPKGAVTSPILWGPRESGGPGCLSWWVPSGVSGLFPHARLPGPTAPSPSRSWASRLPRWEWLACPPLTRSVRRVVPGLSIPGLSVRVPASLPDPRAAWRLRPYVSVHMGHMLHTNPPICRSQFVDDSAFSVRRVFATFRMRAAPRPGNVPPARGQRFAAPCPWAARVRADRFSESGSRARQLRTGPTRQVGGRDPLVTARHVS
jgi:hypothetical protein